MTPDEAKRWIKKAEAKQQVVYHTGYLALDRAVHVFRSGGERSLGILPPPDARALDKTSLLFRQAALSGKVHLVQYKHGELNYDYIAVRR